MRRNIRVILALAGLLGGLLSPLIPVSQAAAVDVFQTCQQQGASNTAVCKATGTDTILGKNGLIGRVINILLIIIGTISIIMIIIGGIRYTTSNGDQAQISSAKNTILYSIVGVVVAVMAYAIVNFVIGSIV